MRVRSGGAILNDTSPRSARRDDVARLMSIFIVLKIVADMIAYLNEHDMIHRGREA